MPTMLRKRNEMNVDLTPKELDALHSAIVKRIVALKASQDDVLDEIDTLDDVLDKIVNTRRES